VLNVKTRSFEALTAVLFHVEVFWVVTPCRFVVGYRRFGGPCCLQCEVKTGLIFVTEMGCLFCEVRTKLLNV